MAQGKLASAHANDSPASGAGANVGSGLAKVAKNPELVMGIMVLGIIAALFVPIPTVLLDVLLATSIAGSVTILLVAIYIKKALDFAAFPTVLLLSTLFRMGLTVASSVNVLTHGAEGEGAVSGLIHAFGHVLIGGNFIIGLVAFALITALNFMVVTKGTGRAAEVAARFTLDAMPGKQMAIDAELNAGHINAEEARRRRKLVEREADFYGTMDGASKFVRGESILAMVTIAINLIVGFIIGVTQHNMSAADAAKTFTLLSVGDGIVAAIPTLLISAAAGIIVTRNSSEGSLGGEIASQFRVHPLAFQIPGGLLILLALIPGFPKLAFFSLAAVLFFLGNRASKSVEGTRIAEANKVEVDEKKQADKDDGNLDTLMKVDILSVEVGHGLVHLIDPSQDGEVVDRIQSIRKQFAQELGLIVPQIQLRDNLQLEPGQYQISLKGNAVATGTLMVDYFLAMDPGNVEMPIHGESTSDPVYGLPATWVHKREKDEAVFRGYTVVNCATVIATHITKALRQFSSELLTRQDVQYLIDRLKETNPKVVEEVLHPERLTVGDVVKVLQNLLKEDVSVRDILSVFECLADHCRTNRNPEVLSEQCRKALGRAIVGKYLSEQKELLVVTFDRVVEDKVLGGLTTTDAGSTFLDLDARTAQEVLQKLMQSVKAFEPEGTQPCLLVSARLRGAFWRFAQAYMPELAVLAYDEVPSGVKVRNLQMISS
ncbi:MAG: flagellar biosynthesis protein FlhA [Silvanigrellales bacterium]|jgi:flagellar biosynthesis protein FlhA|nr:flagellar biosynthesis protein FlhA [Silvanigrellales bacterium]